MIEGIPAWLLRLYGGSVLGEFYPFLMQRSALEVCRNNHLPEPARFSMLPG